MKLKNSLAALASLFLLTSCEHQHVDENKDHLCDVCKMILSEHKDENNDHFCDYCEDQLNGCIDEDLDGKCDICGKDVEPVVPYAVWPEKEIQDEVIVVSGSSVKIPAYEKADDIEINTDDEVESGYFSIYCYTENTNSENEYREILLNAGWEVEQEKDKQGYISAYDPNYEVWINFGYFVEFTDLEICVTYCVKTKWPEKDISDALQIIAPGTKTKIPEFEAFTTIATYYPQYRVLAINAMGYDDKIINEYKQILEDKNWVVTFDDTIDEYVGISPNKDIKVQFYIEDDKGIFNIDVFSYTPPVANWPYEQIANAVASIEATGEILPYLGEFTGVTVDLDWGDPAIIVDVQAGTEVTSANAYNQMLVSKGYVIADEQYLFEDIYVLPGTDLGCRGVYLNNGHNFTIEMCKLSKIAE